MSGLFLVQRTRNHTQVLLSLGNSRAVMVVNAIEAVGICVLIPLLFSLWGVNGAILGTILAPALSVPYIFYMTRPVLGDKQIWFDVVVFVASLIAIGLVFTLS